MQEPGSRPGIDAWTCTAGNEFLKYQKVGDKLIFFIKKSVASLRETATEDNMTSQTDDQIVIMATHGPEDPERATIPFVMALAALASDMTAIIGFQSNGVLLARKDCARHVFAPGFPPLAELMENYLEAGGLLYVCGPCVQSRQLEKDDLIDEAKIVSAATFVVACADAKATLVY
ncbi:MAG: DsrE family protein [Candidatus Promineifilaceae bacterium]|jgi:predicted peroxiredoxin